MGITELEKDTIIYLKNKIVETSNALHKNTRESQEEILVERFVLSNKRFDDFVSSLIVKLHKEFR